MDSAKLITVVLWATIIVIVYEVFRQISTGAAASTAGNISPNPALFSTIPATGTGPASTPQGNVLGMAASLSAASALPYVNALVNAAATPGLPSASVNTLNNAANAFDPLQAAEISDFGGSSYLTDPSYAESLGI